MSRPTPTLHLICGKIAAGKSTLAADLSATHEALSICEDEWLAALFADQMSTGPDFVRCSARLRNIMGPHIVSLLRAGQSVVLDFQANTRESRDWMRALATEAGADHQLHVLLPPDEVCLARLHARNASGTHPFRVTEDMFHRFSRHFSVPTEDEGFTLMIHDQTDGLEPRS